VPNVDVLIRFLATKEASVTSALATLRSEVQAAATAAGTGAQKASAGAAAAASAGKQAAEAASQAGAALKSLTPNLEAARNAVIAAAAGAEKLTLSLGQTQSAVAPVSSIANSVASLGKAMQATRQDAAALTQQLAKVQTGAGKDALDALRAAESAGAAGTVPPSTSRPSSAPPAPPSPPAPSSSAPPSGGAGPGGQTRTINELREATEKLGSVAGKLAISLSGVAIGFAAIGVSVVQRASEMQQFQAKLETVQHSATRAAESVKFAVEEAARTPFNVKGLVEATTQLEVYHQRAREVLPAVENLAAGMSQSIESTSLSLAKALSGSQEGFESLRNEFGISTAALKQFGANVDQQGQLILRTSADIDKAGKAALAFINLNFAGAAERQSRTFAGALSNLEDAGSRLAVAFGNQLLPVLTTLVKGATSVVEAFEGMPDGLKSLIVYGAAATAGAAALGAGLAGLVVLATHVGTTIIDAGKAIGSLAGFARLAGEGASQTAEGLRAIGGAATSVLGALGNLSKGILALVAANPWLAALIAGIGLAAYMLNQWKHQQEEAARALEEQSRDVQRASTEWRGFRDAIADAAKASGLAKDSVGTVSSSINDLITLIDKIPPDKLAQALQARGFDLPALRKKREDAFDDLKSTMHDRDLLQRLQLEMQHQALDPHLLVGGLGAAGLDAADYQRAKELLRGEIVTSEGLRDALGGVQAKYREVREDFTAKSAATTDLEKYSEVLDSLTKQFNSLQAFLNFSENVGSVVSYRDEIIKLDAAIAAMRQKLADTQLPTDTPGIQAYLADPSNDPKAKEALERFGDLIKTRRETITKADEADKQDREKRITAIKTSLDQEAELQNVSVAKRIEAQKQILAIAKGSPELEQREQHNLAVLQKQQRDEGTKDVFKSFEDRLNASKEYVSEKKALNQLSTSDEVSAIGRQIRAIQDFQATHKKLLADPANRDFALGLEKELRGLTVGQAQAVEGDYAKSLANMKSSAEKFLDDQNNGQKRSLEGQLADIDTLTAYFKQGVQQRYIREKDGQAELIQLDKRRAELQQQINERDFQQAQEILQLRQTEQQTRLQELQEQFAEGKQVGDEIIRGIQNETALRFQAIDQVRQHELEVTELTEREKQVIEERTAAAKLDALRAEKQAIDQILAAQNKGAQELANKLQQIKDLAKPEEAKQDESVLPKFGADFDQRNRAQAAADISRIAKKGQGADRSDVDTLRSALELFGITLDTSPGADTKTDGLVDPRTGLPRLSLTGLQNQFGVTGFSSEQVQAFQDRRKQLDDAIKSLEQSLGPSGLAGKFDSLGQKLDALTAAILGSPPGTKPDEQPKAGATGSTPQGPVNATPSSGPYTSGLNLSVDQKSSLPELARPKEEKKEPAQPTPGVSPGAAANAVPVLYPRTSSPPSAVPPQAAAAGALDYGGAAPIGAPSYSSGGFKAPDYSRTVPSRPAPGSNPTPGSRTAEPPRSDSTQQVTNIHNETHIALDTSGLAQQPSANRALRTLADATARRINTALDPTGGFMGGFV
jgi:hypothetical protein